MGLQPPATLQPPAPALSECFDPGRSNLVENDHKDAHHESPEPLRSARHAALVVHDCSDTSTAAAADAAAQPAAALALATALAAVDAAPAPGAAHAAHARRAVANLAAALPQPAAAAVAAAAVPLAAAALAAAAVPRTALAALAPDRTLSLVSLAAAGSAA